MPVPAPVPSVAAEVLEAVCAGQQALWAACAHDPGTAARRQSMHGRSNPSDGSTVYDVALQCLEQLPTLLGHVTAAAHGASQRRATLRLLVLLYGHVEFVLRAVLAWSGRQRGSGLRVVRLRAQLLDLAARLSAAYSRAMCLQLPRARSADSTITAVLQPARAALVTLMHDLDAACAALGTAVSEAAADSVRAALGSGKSGPGIRNATQVQLQHVHALLD